MKNGKKKLTTIADIIHTDDKYRVAIETALADAVNVLVVDKIEDGYAAITELKQHDKGKTSFISLQWVPKILRKRTRQKNMHLVWAVDVVQCDSVYRQLLDFLLEDVVVVDTLDITEEIFHRLTDIRCVTIDGQMVSSSGIIRGGSQRLDQGGLISKKSQISELENEITDLRHQINELTAEQGNIQKDHDPINIENERTAVKVIEKEMTEIEMRIAQLEFEKKRASEGIQRNKHEIDSLQTEIAGLQEHYLHVGKELTILEAKKIAQESHAETTLKELENLEAFWNEKTKEVNELEIKAVTLQNEVRNIDRDIERAEARASDINITLVRREDEISRAQEEIIHLMQDVNLLGTQLSSLKNEYEITEHQKKDIEQTYAARRNDLHQIELQIKDERRLHDDSVSASHELEMKISEIKSNIEHIRLRALEEFEIELQYKTYPDDEWVDFAHLREEVKNLKERIRILGAINFAAFDEFNSESERLNFLTQQRDDLIEAEKTLMNTIEEINNTAQRKFLETFGKIRANFITTFKELFQEGDECDLKLEEGVDPLEANIEIIAKPRGKRPTSIDLLSGGEKTLTAIALLFAIYLVKPSPFCILDEVDAPLDDSNIDRFARILKKFSSNTQFIVVTHNKRTMESAQALYGVTMEEEGVSKIVTVRFNEEARVRSATVTN